MAAEPLRILGGEERRVLTPYSAFYSTARVLDVCRLSMQYLINSRQRGHLRNCVTLPLLAGHRGE